jgi:hypothetical protein
VINVAPSLEGVENPWSRSNAPQKTNRVCPYLFTVVQERIMLQIVTKEILETVRKKALILISGNCCI